MSSGMNAFRRRAEEIMNLPVAVPVGELGGYGPGGEVIYHSLPGGSPVVLIDNRPGCKAVFNGNGSVGFTVTNAAGMEIPVLTGSFDNFEKRETGPLSGNVWLDLTQRGTHGRDARATLRIASLVNPSFEINLSATSRKIVKIEHPSREMFYCAEFRSAKGQAVRSVIRMSLVMTAAGPTVLRQLYLHNDGADIVSGNLWAFFDLHGTQLRVYDKEIWYDMGLPLSPFETVSSCTVPYSDIVEIKRVSTQVSRGIKPVASTCSYLSFVGDSGQFSLLPAAVRRGRLLDAGAGQDLNRFTVPTIAANHFKVNLAPGRSACLQQALLFVTDERIAQRFRLEAGSKKPGFKAIRDSYATAAGKLIARTPGVEEISRPGKAKAAAGVGDYWHVELPADPAVGQFINSVWSQMPDLYGRDYGGRIADGVELPFRDRCQDMWPILRLDPGRVREDLVYTFGYMYHTMDMPPAARGISRVAGILPARLAAVSAANISEDRRLCEGKMPSPLAGGTPATLFQRPPKPLTLLEKLHGSYPRQYPSLWLDRTKTVRNDNRPFSDSPAWLLESLLRYIRQTGDASILGEETTTVEFVDPADPAGGGIRGGKKRQTVMQAVLEILSRYQRLCADSPYGMVQLLYGDWADPVDLMGTDRIGDPARRGLGRGVTTRLSAQVFLVTLDVIDLLEAGKNGDTILFSEHHAGQLTAETSENSMVSPFFLKQFADELRQAIMRHAWEDTPGRAGAGFVDSIHELTRTGRRPKLDKGEIGYALGSMRANREFDGTPRRVLTSLAYGLRMLLAERDFLTPIPNREQKVQALLRTVDELAYEQDVGLKLYTRPLANSPTTLKFVGRMGLLPSGCAENGEYHHGQAFMHRFRADLPGQADAAWTPFRQMLSVVPGERLLGPFDSLANSFASDRDDPYFGAGMLFGFSGTADWIIETVEAIAGIEVDLFDPRRPDVRITPRLPKALASQLSFRRMIHQHVAPGRYRQIPLNLTIRPAGPNERPGTRINGRAVEKAEVQDISGLRKIDVEMILSRTS